MLIGGLAEGGIRISARTPPRQAALGARQHAAFGVADAVRPAAVLVPVVVLVGVRRQPFAPSPTSRARRRRAACSTFLYLSKSRLKRVGYLILSLA